jgi:hypothetical protein
MAFKIQIDSDKKQGQILVPRCTTWNSSYAWDTM